LKEQKEEKDHQGRLLIDDYILNEVYEAKQVCSIFL
jgi:hypothetical protein